MKINFAAAILDLDNKLMKEDDSLVTLGKLTSSALLAPYRDEAELPAKDKIERFYLATKAKSEEEYDLTVEEVALIKKLINKAFPSPMVVARCYELIEGAKIQN